MFTRLLFLIALLFQFTGSYGQEIPPNNDAGRISGSLESAGKFFIRDSLIGAFNTPQYDRQLYSADAWLNVLYSRSGLDAGIRFDIFQNSSLLNPTGSFTEQGIGRWFIRKKIHKLDLTAGHIYDIIGSGAIFRAYEDRALAIDQALYGLQLGYELTPDWNLKVFSGRQKKQFETYRSIIRGASTEGYLYFNSANFSMAPGLGVVARTLDDGSMNNLVATLNTYQKVDIFTPRFNTYSYTVYNTLSKGPFNWYLEAAYKSKDAIHDPFLKRVTSTGDTVVGRLMQKTGSLFYTSLSYANKGLGITLEGKRTENFDFRTQPQEEGNRGLLHFIPPMSRVNTYQLLARYAPATQYIGELALQGDIRYSFNKKMRGSFNFSNIQNLDGRLLYRELYAELFHREQKWSISSGFQYLQYNQDVYQGKPGAPEVQSFTPFIDFLYKFHTTRALRFECQYMHVPEKDNSIRPDYGSWLFGLAELTLAPHWSFTASDMINIAPGKLSPKNIVTGKSKTIHFLRLEAAYTHRSNRFAFGFLKQPEGIVCSGGVCRLEPAFNGLRLNVLSSFN